MAKILTAWKKDPKEVYILGYRFHHGLVCAGMALYGLYKGDSYLFGAGVKGVEDDLADIDHWLDFEKGGNPNSLIDII